MKRFLIAGALVLAATPAFADPIEGTWLSDVGNRVSVAPCAQGYCMGMTSGPNSGKSLGWMKPDGSRYVGELEDPADGKVYSGHGEIKGDTLELSGCVLIFCQTRVFTRP